MDVNETAIYLGDGVYARHDGYHVALITDEHTVYLDPYVLAALLAYVERLNKGAEHGNDDTA